MQWRENPYITFRDVTPEGRLTRVVEVVAVRDGALLGTIRWFGRWRKYAFHVEPDCWFEEGCLEAIAVNMAVLTQEHRKARAA